MAKTAPIKTIGNPMTFAGNRLLGGSRHLGEGLRELRAADNAPIEIYDLYLEDLRSALRRGFEDFSAMRSDVMFIVLLYPVIGVLLAAFAINQNLLPLLFPLVSGFALLGPVLALPLYKMSRRREAGEPVGWGDAFAVFRTPNLAPILVLGGYLLMLFAVWMLVAFGLYNVTLGPGAPTSAMTFLTDIFTTGAGLTMLVLGVAIGGIFAVMVLASTVVSFPLLLDRHVGLPRAVTTSMAVTRHNPLIVATWGAVVVVLLGLGMVTLFLGLIVVLPVLGHATWHLYRAAVVPRHAEV